MHCPVNEYIYNGVLFDPRKNEILSVTTEWILEVGDHILNELSQMLHFHTNV